VKVEGRKSIAEQKPETVKMRGWGTLFGVKAVRALPLAPLAYRVAKSLLQDEQVSARVRADLAIKVLDRADHTMPTRKDDPAREEALSEMSREELAAFIEKSRVEIDKVAGRGRR